MTRVRGLLRRLCREVLECRAVPGGMLIELATDIAPPTSITGLAEAMNAAGGQSLPRDHLMRAMLSGPLVSNVPRVKAPKLAARDFAPQASVLGALASAELTYTAEPPDPAAPIGRGMHAQIIGEAA